MAGRNRARTQRWPGYRSAVDLVAPSEDIRDDN